MNVPNALSAKIEASSPLARPAKRSPWSYGDGLGQDFAACARLRQVELDWFRSRGVSGFCLLGYLDDPALIGAAAHELLWRGRLAWTPGFEVRRAKVQFQIRGTFIFEADRHAEPDQVVAALIVPMLDEDAHLVDLVAWHPRTARLASLYRRSGLLRGPDFRAPDEPLVVHRDPLSWLAACRRGAVVVHEALARPVLLDETAVQAADIAHGAKLKAMLERVRLPKIVVPAASIRPVAA